MLNKNKSLLIAIFWTVLISILSLIKFGNMGGDVSIPYKDKYVHFVFYFVFTIVWNRVFNYENFKIKNLINIVIAAILFGIVMEICQSLFTTTRSADVYDALANTFGATISFVFITKYWNKKVQNKTQNH